MLPDRIDWHQRFIQQSNWTISIREHLSTKLNFCDAENIIELGCGTGVITEWLRSIHCHNVYGLDVDRTNLQTGKTHYNDQTITCADVYHSPFPEGMFDISLFHYFLMWMSDPLEALIEIKRITKKGGLIIALAEPDYGGRIDFPNELTVMGKLQTNTLLSAGADPFIGRKLGHLFNKIGLSNINIGLLGAEWKMPVQKYEIEGEWGVISDDLDKQLSINEIDKLKDINEKAYEADERILFVPTFYAWGFTQL